MEQVVEKLDTAVWDDVHEALTSGEYKQTTGGMCQEKEDGTKAHCCMGVINEVVFETDWYDPNSEGFYSDNDGEESNISDYKAAVLNLNQKLTHDEVTYLLSYGNVDRQFDRHIALAHLNDNGVDFNTIDMIITELEWDKV